MHFAKSLLAAAMALTAVVSAAPSSAATSTPFHILIKGLPKKATDGNKTYLAYEKNFFGELALGITTDEAAALQFNVLQNGNLESMTGQGLSLAPLYNAAQTEETVYYYNYTGTEGTYVKGHQVSNSNGNFSSWLVTYSQYGAGIGYATPKYNASAITGYPFPSYEVKFHLKH